MHAARAQRMVIHRYTGTRMRSPSGWMLLNRCEIARAAEFTTRIWVFASPRVLLCGSYCPGYKQLPWLVTILVVSNLCNPGDIGRMMLQFRRPFGRRGWRGFWPRFLHVRHADAAGMRETSQKRKWCSGCWQLINNHGGVTNKNGRGECKCTTNVCRYMCICDFMGVLELDNMKLSHSGW